MDMYQKRKIRAEKKNNNQEEKLTKVVLNWYPGHMAKTKRQIKENIDLIDIVYEVIDARIPLSSKNKDIDLIIKNKPRIIIMTKFDLCDYEKTRKWKEYYESLGYNVVLVDLINKPNIEPIIEITTNLLKDLTEKRKSRGLKERKARALIVGIPNVGKSTLINRLVGKKAVNIGNKPGITKQLEWIRINSKIELLDTPGILWPRFDNQNVALNLASMMAIKEEILDLEEVAIYVINTMLKLYPGQLKERYNIKEENDIFLILDEIGKKIGAIRNHETDYDKVYSTILKDLREGYLGKITFD